MPKRENFLLAFFAPIWVCDLGSGKKNLGKIFAAYSVHVGDFYRIDSVHVGDFLPHTQYT